MKPTIYLFVIIIAAMIGCKQEAKKDSPDVLKKVLSDYFDGIKNKDYEKMKAVTTPDFVIFDVGNVWNNDSMIKVIESFPPFTIDYTLDNFNIQIGDSIGNMHYFNHADVVISDTLKMTHDWIESATFVKENTGWKMNFLHSTVKK